MNCRSNIQQLRRHRLRKNEFYDQTKTLIKIKYYPPSARKSRSEAEGLILHHRETKQFDENGEVVMVEAKVCRCGDSDDTGKS